MRRSGIQKTWLNNESGNVGMIFAASIIPVVMLIGSAVDFGDASKKRATLQLAIDAAALAAARTVDDDVTAAIDEAAKVFEAKVEGTDLEGVVPTITADGGTITLTAHVASKTAFMKIVNIDEFNLNVRAVAERGQEESSGDSTADGKVCLLALDPNATHGLEMQGSKTADLGTCWAYVNSESAESVDDTGNSYSFVSSGVCTAGLSSLDHADNFSIKPREGCSAMADPFANTGAYPSAASWSPKLTMPQITDKDCKAGTLNLKRGTFVLDPGQYCGGIRMQAQAKVTFNPGIYKIADGALYASSGSQLTGTDVLFYFGDVPNSTYTGNQNIDIQGGATVSLTGRHSGSTYEGFLVIQNALAGQGQTSIIQGGGTFNMEGVLYMPTQKLEMGGNGDMNGSSKYFMAVAKEFEMRGSGHLYIKQHQSSSLLPDITPDLPEIDAKTARLTE